MARAPDEALGDLPRVDGDGSGDFDQGRLFAGHILNANLSIAKVHVLQWLVDLEALDQIDYFLQIVPLLAGDAQLIALDRRLHFHFCALDLLDDPLGEPYPSHPSQDILMLIRRVSPNVL
jgi:hypothetical protein